jgi:transcriptional regulator with XRE-family HTH domain
MRALGTRMRKVRRDREMTQAELAKKVGVTRQQVQNWETGRRNAMARLAEIAAALRISESGLLDYDGPVPAPRGTTVLPPRGATESGRGKG